MDNQDASGGVYFLGSIVLVREPNNPHAKVIDGQQRLTTLTILLSILRDLTANPEVKIERRNYVFQKASADRGTDDRYRLLLRERDRPFFLKYVQNPDATDSLADPSRLQGSQQRIAENTRYLRAELEGLSEERRNALTAFIIQRCYLVVVAVPTAETARRIFTVLNARGLDLTPTDILKANLLERVGTNQESALANRWESVEQALGRDTMVELFGHIRMIYEREKPRLSLEDGFPKYVPPFNDSAETFLSSILEPISDALQLLSNPEAIKTRFGTEASKAVRSLDRIDNKDWVPPALLSIWKDSPDAPSTVATFLSDLERVAYFLFVTREGVNERIARYAAVMDELDPRLNREVPATGVDLTPIEQADFLAALSGPLYLKTRVCKPVLQRLDEALSSGGASYDELVSIEHVLPQTVNEKSEWALLFPDEQQRTELVHKIANLVFLTRRINIRASNWDFDKKKREYFSSNDGSSPFVITQGVLQASKWTPAHLAERQNRLVRKLSEVWLLAMSDSAQAQASVAQTKGERKFTDGRLIEEKRKFIMSALSRREGVNLNKSGALYSTADGKFRVACTISKRYANNRAPYWYGYSAQWRDFLAQGEKSLLVLGSMDRETAYAIPAAEMESVLGQLHRTPNKHWHIVLGEGDAKDLEIVVPNGSKVPLKRFEFTSEKIS